MPPGPLPSPQGPWARPPGPQARPSGSQARPLGHLNRSSGSLGQANRPSLTAPRPGFHATRPLSQVSKPRDQALRFLSHTSGPLGKAPWTPIPLEKPLGPMARFPSFEIRKPNLIALQIVKADILGWKMDRQNTLLNTTAHFLSGLLLYVHELIKWTRRTRASVPPSTYCHWSTSSISCYSLSFTSQIKILYSYRSMEHQFFKFYLLFYLC